MVMYIADNCRYYKPLEKVCTVYLDELSKRTQATISDLFGKTCNTINIIKSEEGVQTYLVYIGNKYFTNFHACFKDSKAYKEAIKILDNM